MKLAIIEPHPDDAFLSVGWHIEKIWKPLYEITIVTVFCDEKRAKEAQAYASKLGVACVTLGLPESEMNGISKPTVIKPLKELLTTSGFDRTVFPIGLQHPDHISVASSRFSNSWRYVDTPYQCKQKIQDELRRKVEGRSIVSIAYPPKTKWRHIPIFKSQSKFFYFNDMESSHPCELVLE